MKTEIFIVMQRMFYKQMWTLVQIVLISHQRKSCLSSAMCFDAIFAPQFLAHLTISIIPTLYPRDKTTCKIPHPRATRTDFVPRVARGGGGGGGW